MSHPEHEHDWRINPFVQLPTNPPRRELVCATCGKKGSMPEGSTSVFDPDDPTDWPKLK